MNKKTNQNNVKGCFLIYFINWDFLLL